MERIELSEQFGGIEGNIVARTMGRGGLSVHVTHIKLTKMSCTALDTKANPFVCNANVKTDRNKCSIHEF